MARAGEEGHEEHNASRPQKPPPPQTFFWLHDEEDAEGRGAARGRSRTLGRRSVEHIVDFVRFAPTVHILDAPVPQKGDRTSCISSARSRLFLSRLSRCPRSCLMMSLCEPLFVIRNWRNSWWKCRRTRGTHLRWLPRGSFRAATSGDFSQDRVQQRLGPSRSLTFQFLRVGGARRGWWRFVRFFPGQNSIAADVEQIVDFPARGGLPGFRPGQGSTASSSSRLLHDAGQRFFSHFSLAPKKCGGTRQSCARVPAGLIKWLLPGSLSLERTRLATPCPLHMRLYGGCGGGEEEVGERAEAEAAGALCSCFLTGCRSSSRW